MFVSNTRALRWPSQIVLGMAASFLLVQVILRALRRAAPRPMPSRFAPVLTSPWRSRLFGAPELTLDRSGVEPGMRVLEIEGEEKGQQGVPTTQLRG